MKKICPVCKTENEENALLCVSCMEDISKEVPIEEDKKLILFSKETKITLTIKHFDKIGRNHQQELKDFKTISREHCKVYFENGYWYIEDLGSTNGTFLNGKKLMPYQKARIKDEDEIKISSSITFEVRT